MSKKNRNTEASLSKKNTKKVKKSRAERKREKLEAKNAVLPVHKRPIICPPDAAGRHPAFRWGGFACRALVIFCASAGLTAFISDALQFGVSHGFILLVSFITVALASLMCCGPIPAVIASVIGAGLAAWRLVTVPNLIADLFWGLLALYNGALERLYRVGYLTYVQYEAAIGSPTAYADLLKVGVALLAILFSLVFTLCLVRRVKLVPPAILSTTLLVVILTFNIYSNRIETNLGIVLVIISFAALLVMAAFDRLYRVKDAKKYDTEFKLFEDTDRPQLPEAYVEAQRQKKQKKADRKAAKKQKKKASPLLGGEPQTVEQELTDYFSEKPKKEKAKAKKEKKDPAQRKAEKAEKRAMMKQVRAVRTYDRVTEQSRGAMGGFAAAAALLIFLLIILLPALMIKGNFNTIQAIDEKMAYARDYVTAVLRGDDAALDELEYGADGSNFESHSTDLKQLEFTGKQIFYVKARYNTNYYMTGWIGTDYDAAEGAWKAVSDEQFDAYRALFKAGDSPAETMRYNFYHNMKPSAVDDPEYNENLMGKYKANLDLGFINVLVHTRRVNSPGSSLYLPATVATPFPLYDYETTDESKLTFVNYFDGIRTGRKFKDRDASYASVAYAPVMTNANWSRNVGDLAASWALQKEGLLARTGYTVNADTKEVTSWLKVSTLKDDKPGLTLVTYEFKKGSETRYWRFYHANGAVKSGGGQLVITTDAGTLTLVLSGSYVNDVILTGCETETGMNLIDRYDQTMTDAEREALIDSVLLDRDYSDFVYDTYTQKGESQIIADLAKTIQAQAHTEVEKETREVIPDDPETEEDESDEIITIEYVNVPADVSLAALRNTADADAFVQRDLLVRNVIDYIITELGCEYTITPDLSTVDAALDGVENFLVNTHEGYCMQFASAAALILREYGIPVRFVEGYIANNLQKERGDFVYGTYVHDYEAHAWIEVWFDGLGWIQYETTPQYYTGLYGTKGSGGTIHVDPIMPDEETTTHEVETDKPFVNPTETETETEIETEDPAVAETLRTAGFTFLILVGIGVIVMVIATIVNKARDAEENRQRVANTILEPTYGEHTNESDRRETSLEMLTAVTDLLAIYGLAPKPGEFRDEYADRLTVELTSETEDGSGKKPRRSDGPALPDLHVVMDAMAAEEFGSGMTISEMKLVATLYYVLRKDLKHYVPLSERLRLRYIKRKI